MKEFKQINGPFIHTTETYKKRIFSYIIVFIAFLIYTFYINEIKSLFKTTLFTLLPITIVSILEVIYKIIYIKNQSLKTYIKENFSIFSILFFPFLLNPETPIYITIISVIIGYILYKILFKKKYSLTILSYTIYLLLSLLTKNNIEFLQLLPLNYTNQITNNGNFPNLILNGSKLMSPLITILSFIYLSIKKDIKKEITISSLITIIFITIIVGLTQNSIWLTPYFLLTGGTLFIITILANDFYSPATKTGKITYGIFIGLLIIILRFISNYNISPLSILIANTFTFTFDYVNEFVNKKIIYIASVSLVLITTILITILI